VILSIIFSPSITIAVQQKHSTGQYINTINGNMNYARYLYQREKTNPWISSMPCWNPNPIPEQTSQSSPTTSVPTSTSNTLTTNLIFGMVHPQVQTLQIILNRLGFVISSNGPGSLGNETTKFGALTRVAVRSFQCAQNIICSGDEYTTAYGLVGPRTRDALLRVAQGGAGSVPAPLVTAIPINTAEVDRIVAIKAQIAQLQKQIADLQSKLPQ